MERHNSNRTPYKFEDDVKHEARERSGGKCEWCGKEVPNLEAHHLVAIHIAREVPCLALEVIKSLANIAYVCSDCHSAFHATPETPDKYIPYVAHVAQKYMEMQTQGKKPVPEKLYRKKRR